MPVSERKKEAEVWGLGTGKGELMGKFELGQKVICSTYVRKSGNHYETDKERNTFCEFWAGGATEAVIVEDFHSCDLLVRIPASFRGVYVGTTHRATRLSVEYDEPPYGKNGFYFSKDESRPFAIVYYADNKKRLVPMDAIWSEEEVEAFESAKCHESGKEAP